MTDNRHTYGHETERDADTFVRRLGDSAQQVWLAGLGAFNRAQSEGTRLFDSLVSEGRDYEKKHKDVDPTTADLRQNVEAGIGQARERGNRAWSKVEQAFDDQVQGVLKRLNVPCREDVGNLEQQIQALRLRMGELEGQLSRHQARCQCGSTSPTASTTSSIITGDK